MTEMFQRKKKPRSQHYRTPIVDAEMQPLSTTQKKIKMLTKFSCSSDLVNHLSRETSADNKVNIRRNPPIIVHHNIVMFFLQTLKKLLHTNKRICKQVQIAQDVFLYISLI